MMIDQRANKELQRKLRRMIDFDNITNVSRQFCIGRDSIVRYLADFPVRRSTFASIEAIVAAATATDDE